MKKYTWLLFDADNTLFDFHRCEGEALRLAMERIGISFDGAHHQLYSRLNKQCWKDFEEKKISKEELRLRRFELFFAAINCEADTEAFGTDYLGHLAGAAFLFDGALDLLENLRRDFRLALVTNGLKEVQRPRLEAGKLTDYFEAVIVSDEIGYAKPHAPFFDYTFAQIGQPAKDQVMIIGDNINADIKGGLDYGIHACWFNPEAEELPAAIRPTYEIRRLDELVALCAAS